MRNLNLIIDSSTSPKVVSNIVKLKPKKILLFEINENLTFKKKLSKNISSSCVIIEINLNKKKIESSVKLKDDYVELIGKFKSLKVDTNKKINLIKFLRLGNISHWWLTTIAEKNPLKRDTYIKINTLHNLIATIKKYEFKSIYIDIEDRELSSAIANNLSDFYFILKNKKSYPDTFYLIYAIFNASILFTKLILRSLTCKIFYKKNNNSINTYPFVYVSTLSNSYIKNHKNPYFQFLIDEMAKNNIKYKDLFMLNGFNVLKNISDLNELKAGTNKNYDLLDRYFRFIDIFVLLGRYIYLSSRLSKVKKAIRKNSYFKGMNIFNLLIGDIYISLVGQQAIENLHVDTIFKQYFKKNKNMSKYLYPMEMQAWEKILNSYKNIKNKDIVSFGIQHVPASSLMLNYFYSKEELKEINTPMNMPKPDKALLFSDKDYELFKKMGWEKDKISNFGSIRFHDFKSVKQYKWSEKENSVAIVLPGNRKQSTELIKYLESVIPNLKEYKFYISFHPDSGNFLDLILKKLIQLDNCFCSKKDTVELVKNSKILISYGTSAILGGVINNCYILIPVLSSSLPLDPAFNKIKNIKFIIDKETMISEINMVMRLNQEPKIVKDLCSIKYKYINLENKKNYIDQLI